MCRLTLPRAFWEDHFDRCADHPGKREEIKTNARTVIVELDAEALDDLRSDADHYGDANGWESWLRPLIRSAQMTKQAIERQCPERGS
jgi:hypothetical protein